MKKTYFAIIIAAILWFVMFFAPISKHLDFWTVMTGSALVLTGLATLLGGSWWKETRLNWKSFVFGLLAAAGLWLVFYFGDRISAELFTFARSQVDSIYTIKGDTSKLIIGVLLLLVIGPAEEIFWRGFVQRKWMEHSGKFAGFAAATLVYTLIHVWSLNFMLIMAALVCGVFWGLIYLIWGHKSLPVLIISHALWDVAAFVLFPF